MLHCYCTLLQLNYTFRKTYSDIFSPLYSSVCLSSIVLFSYTTYRVLWVESPPYFSCAAVTGKIWQNKWDKSILHIHSITVIMFYSSEAFNKKRNNVLLTYINTELRCSLNTSVVFIWSNQCNYYKLFATDGMKLVFILKSTRFYMQQLIFVL